MKKLVLKTVAITLASIVGASIIAFFSFWLFAPKSLASLFDGVGNYSASVFFYEKNYYKTGDIEDLALLIDKLDDNDNQKLEELLSQMFANKDFNSYCENQDNGSSTLISTKEYYFGLYAVTLITNKKIDGAITFSTDYVNSNGYTKNNPLRMIIAEFSFNKSVLEECKSAIASLNLSGEGLALAQNDINDINNLLEK